jgi:micrococcal nuclease
LWIPPWDFRRGKSNKIKNNISGSYHGNLSSKVFHASDCQYYNCKNCLKILQDRESAIKSAIKSGYKPCGICKP